jgi:predicted dehydrogenase
MTQESVPSSASFTRREFVKAATAAGAGIALAAPVWASASPNRIDDLNVAIIGVGSQGRNLLTRSLKIPGLRFRAVCDIWDFYRDYVVKMLGKVGHQARGYVDYQDMLAKEKDLDAVIVATPDFVHAEHTNACLNAGMHVYCEKEMSNTLQGAASMVRTARQTGKLLQIGHQRRSNPRYWHALKLIEKDKVLGRITHVQGQWNRHQRLDVGYPEKYALSAARLKKYGYENMEQLANWRWYRHLSGGPMADLGSHQIDVFLWFLKAVPSAVMATGGIDYYSEKGRDWFDNVLSLYTFDTAQDGHDQTVRGFYQVLNTTSHGGYYETFMGDGGSLVVSENTEVGHFFREPTVTQRRDWEDKSDTVTKNGREAIELRIGETLTAGGQKTPEAQKLMEEMTKPIHQLHLENFFDAVRDPKNNRLSCPPEVAYETAVAVLTANEAVEAKRQIDLKPEQFRVS